MGSGRKDCLRLVDRNSVIGCDLQMQNRTLPNFLIVGAPKSGTSSVCNYLAQHPEIFISPVKEPKYFSSQVVKFPHTGPGDHNEDAVMVKDLAAYKQLFSNATNEIAIGEGSVDNLYYHRQVIPLIKDLLGDVKIIIILRNPVDRAFSNYLHLLRDGRETKTFEQALELETVRKNKNYEYFWHYKTLGLYYEQVDAYLSTFSSVEVKIFDDLVDNSLDLQRNLHSFLGVKIDFAPNVNKKFNTSGAPKNKYIHNFIVRDNFLKSLMRPLLRRIFNEKMRKDIYTGFLYENIKKIAMEKSTRINLTQFFENDIKRLSTLINRDLTHWLSALQKG